MQRDTHTEAYIYAPMYVPVYADSGWGGPLAEWGRETGSMADWDDSTDRASIIGKSRGLRYIRMCTALSADTPHRSICVSVCLSVCM
jgi:hypothetical protein